MIDIIRAWTDVEYRNTLTVEELAQVPAHPAGAVEIQDATGAASRMSRTQDTCGACRTQFSGAGPACCC